MKVKRKVGPKRRLWTVDEYYKLCELGFFQEERVQLIEGEIIVMPAQKNSHALAITLTHDVLRAVFGPNYWVRVQMSLDLTPHSVLDPDLAVVPGSPRSHNTNQNPTSALLIVEVSETTLRFDRYRKASLYARAGIEDYWIVNLIHQQLEVRRRPIPDSGRRYGFAYAERTILRPNEYVSPLAMPQAKILVADLLP